MITVDILEAQNKRLREENEELREEVRQLRAQIAPAGNWPDWLPALSASEMLVLELLRPGRLVTHEQIMDGLYGDEPEPPGSNMPGVWIHKLRRKLEATGVDILVVWGRGYQLTPAGRDLLRLPVAEAA